MLFCISPRGGLTNGQQGAAEQSREAQTQEGEAEARTACVFFFCCNEQERRGKEARLTSTIEARAARFNLAHKRGLRRWPLSRAGGTTRPSVLSRVVAPTARVIRFIVAAEVCLWPVYAFCQSIKRMHLSFTDL